MTKRNIIITLIILVVGIAIYYVLNQRAQMTSAPSEPTLADSRYNIVSGKDDMGMDVTGYGVNIPVTLEEAEAPQYQISDSVPNFPLYEKATSSGKLAWSTSDSVPEVMHWYLLALDDLGWEADSIVDNPDSSDKQTVVLTRGTQNIKLTVTKSSQGTTIEAKEQ